LSEQKHVYSKMTETSSEGAGSPRSDAGQDAGSTRTSTTNTPDEVCIDSSKQTVPILKGAFPTPDAVEEWSMGFEAALSILNLGDVLEEDWGIEDIRPKTDKDDDERAKLLKNDKVFNHLITATRDGAEIVEDN
jgi:hypothetical protein